MVLFSTPKACQVRQAAAAGSAEDATDETGNGNTSKRNARGRGRGRGGGRQNGRGKKNCNEPQDQEDQNMTPKNDACVKTDKKREPETLEAVGAEAPLVKKVKCPESEEKPKTPEENKPAETDGDSTAEAEEPDESDKAPPKAPKRRKPKAVPTVEDVKKAWAEQDTCILERCCVIELQCSKFYCVM